MTGLEYLIENCDSFKVDYKNYIQIEIEYDKYDQAEYHDKLYMIYNINKQVEILQEVLNELMTGFESPDDRMDFILDIVNGYKKRII
jgi:hypothetical protein